MKRRFILLAFIFSFIIFSCPIKAEKIKIIIRQQQQPFAFEKDGKFVGYAYELWEQVAKEAGLEFDVSKGKNATEVINVVKNKNADVAVGALSVTAQREDVIDFAQPFFDSGLQILVKGGNDSGFLSSIWQILSSIFSWQVIGLVVIMFVLMAVVSHLVWLYEHKVNENMWPKNYKKGIWESFWWTISMLLVGGADNKGPIGVGGRVVAIAWMFLSIIFISMLTATFTTSLTVKSLKAEINGPEDLEGKTVATVKGSTAETWLKNKGSNVLTFDDVNICIKQLKKGKVKAVVYDFPIIQYAINQLEDEELMLVGPVFERQNYAFALQSGSNLRERINHALLLLNERGVAMELKKKWFGVQN
ncbi:MAG: transporter substrate-binding domain-containing protein [Bacteroidota bacterium]|jgi:polar amino acid transport system substrate-binding protein